MDLSHVGSRIKAARKAQDMTQEQLAEKSGIAAGHMGIIERGIKVPQLDNFVAICNALHVSADELLQDVVDVSVSYSANEVSKKLEKLPVEEQRKILRAISILAE